MREWFEEFLVILSHSPRTQIALLLGLVFFVGIHLTGAVLLSGVDATGVMGPLMEAIQEKLGRRYDRLAWFSLGSFWLLALKSYLKDRKRLLCL